MPQYITDPDILAQLNSTKPPTPQDFAKTYGAVAARAGKALGVDPQVLLGQWGLETGWGKSIVPGTNNLGNIKDLAGGGVGATDNMTGSRDKYRAYESPDAFADDYVSLLQRKYPGAVGAGSDAAKFTAGLKGYAEDPRYAEKVGRAARVGLPSPASQPVSAAESAPAASSASAPERQYISDPELLAQLSAEPEKPGVAASIGAGLGKGAGAVALGAQNYLGKGLALANRVLGSGSSPSGAGGIANMLVGDAGKWLQADAEAGRNKLASQNAPYFAANPVSNTVGEVSGNVLATLPVGGFLGAGAKAAGASRFGNALASGGATTGVAVPGGVVNALAGIGIRMAGGGVGGAASAALIDPDAIGVGAAVGAALPPTLAGLDRVGRALGGVVRPFYQSGQNKLVGNTLREFATDPVLARNQLQAATELVPGSAPIVATAAGDDGLAALSRAMQNASPEYAANLAARQTAQNQARTSAIEGIAGNTGKIDLAKAARDASTGPMREEVLSAAGNVPVDRVLRRIDAAIKDPNNAGELSQQALNKFRGRIGQWMNEDGTVSARALYEIRKDIGTLQSGKLQGEAGNLRYASGQLSGVKGIIDDAIDEASRRVPAAKPAAPASASRDLATREASNAAGAVRPVEVGAYAPGVPSDAAVAAGPRASWRQYLQSYAEQSIPIRQMEKLDEILKSVQTGTVDSQGGAILSAAKLNNLLKNQGSKLADDLNPEQLRILRAVQADLNAGQIANNTGRAVGSNTLQNIAQSQLLRGVLGNALGGSTSASSTLGRVLQLPYGTANKQIQERLGNALLDPRAAARLMADPETGAIVNMLSGAGSIGYRAAPAISAR